MRLGRVEDGALMIRAGFSVHSTRITSRDVNGKPSVSLNPKTQNPKPILISGLWGIAFRT